MYIFKAMTRVLSYLLTFSPPLENKCIFHFHNPILDAPLTSSEDCCQLKTYCHCNLESFRMNQALIVMCVLSTQDVYACMLKHFH